MVSGLVERFEKLVLFVGVHGEVLCRVGKLVCGNLAVKLRQSGYAFIVNLPMQAPNVAEGMRVFGRCRLLAGFAADVGHEQHHDVAGASRAQ